MRLFLALTLFLVIFRSNAQVREYVPFSEATKAIKKLGEEPIVKDSLKRIYHGKITLGFIFGRRHISGENKAGSPDTVTFTDFNDKRGFIGLELGYFIEDRWQLVLSGDLLILPKEQDISSIQFGGSGGISVEGQGSGGAMITVGIEGRYFFHEQSLTRPYAKLETGMVRAVAIGGEGGFTFGQGQFQNRRERRELYRYLQPGFGVSHRMARQAILDFNLSYLFSADRSRNIGGIESPGGITGTISFHFVFGDKK